MPPPKTSDVPACTPQGREERMHVKRRWCGRKAAYKSFFCVVMIAFIMSQYNLLRIRGGEKARTLNRLRAPLFYSTIRIDNRPRLIGIDDGENEVLGYLWRIPTKARNVKEYPTKVSDPTQLYPKLVSNDARYKDNVVRRKFPKKHGEAESSCASMSTWQTTFYPTCHDFHALDMRQKTYEKSLKLVGTKGFWRLAWKVDDTDETPRGPHSIFGADNRTNVIYGNFFSNYPSSVILKTLKYRHNFEEGYYESNRVDAVAMERLTPSPNVVNIYGFCGQSVVTELAASPTLKALISKTNSLGKLGVARDVASGLADVHGIDDHGAKGGTASLVHNDINPSNIVATRGGVPKLNDFNIGVLMTWDEGKNRPCPFLGRYPNAQWRAPEEQWIGGKRSKTPLTEKVDVYALGNIFFGIIAGQDPWRELRSKGGSIGGESKARLAEAKSRGTLPALPDEVRKSHDPSIVAVRDMMMECFRADPEKRPTAEYVNRNLTAVLESLAN